ncbi:MAG: hypothetical protein FWH01_15965 [Oscillospiraceae bacterium]|nr:hypothetical protein [Oscillospiraceae bacterium]
MKEFVISSMLLGLAIAFALNLLFSGINKLSGRAGQNISIIRFSSFIRTAIIASILVMLLR